MLQDRAEQVKGRKATKPRSRKKKTDVRLDESTQPTELVDARLESKMLDAIREDEEFYHRILRYDVRLLHFLESRRRTTDQMYSTADSSGRICSVGHNVRLSNPRTANKGYEIFGRTGQSLPRPRKIVPNPHPEYPGSSFPGSSKWEASLKSVLSPQL
jgi:hypothetical protein